jgi:hypothetical protein
MFTRSRSAPFGKMNTHLAQLAVASLFLLSSACNFIPSNNEPTENPNLEATRIARSVGETLAANDLNNTNATSAAQQSTLQAQAGLSTQAAQTTALVTSPPVQATQPSQASALPPQPAPITQNPPSGDFKQWMNSAQILLFEDVVGNPGMSRYIKQTLDGMNLRYKDDGNAIGWLKNDLLSGSRTGKPWDLVIIAVEARGNVSGEYFDYLKNVIDAKSSVILEAWHLDAISEGKVGPILAECGVQVYPYFTRAMNLTDVVLYPYPAAAASPITNDPNKGLSFTKSLNTWLFTGDLGSLMAYTGHGDAVFLLGRNPEDDVRDGALASCMSGRLTLQTFSSHSFSYKTIYPLWENYIINALRVRFGGG